MGLNKEWRCLEKLVTFLGTFTRDALSISEEPVYQVEYIPEYRLTATTVGVVFDPIVEFPLQSSLHLPASFGLS